MSKSINKEKNVVKSNLSEMILAVKKEILFKEEYFNGLKKLNNQEIEKYLNIIDKNKEFIERDKAEKDLDYKQIIPYLIFNYQDKYFLMQRKSTATEQRLKNKFSLGIGGHIREEDIKTKNIIDWAKREFEEEINYNQSYKVELIGILNDDSDPVGQVHIGFIFLIKGDSDQIKVRSELKSGELLNLSQLLSYYEEMENWSKIIYKYL